MKKTFRNNLRKATTALLLSGFALLSWGANKTTTVEQVSGSVTLSEAVDYVITGTDPFADGAVLNITDTENAVVILTHVKPSVALNSHLKHIQINGVKAVKNSNCMVKVYANGCIILPHGNSIKPLVVYSEKDQQGETAEFAAGNRQSLERHALNNKIQSFTLKRGYMVWFATKSSEKDPGYNRVFIADKADISVNLPNILSSSVSALRVSQWNDTSKKGYAGWDPAYNEPLNTTWCYSWDAGINIWDDREYVTHHHHEGWPGITDVGNNGTSPSILGNNEPDNTADDREQVNTVAEVLATWPQMMATGRRLGSPAVAGNYAWLYEFMDSIDARGWRCDFVAVHAYWYSDWGSWNSQLSGIRNRTGRPIWITEMNYGANWTGWPGANTEGNATNYAIQLQHMGPIIDGLENTPWIERYAYYNWVQDCRMAIDGNMKLTPIGEYYANKESGMAYSSTYNVVPKLPKMKDPANFTMSYDKATTTATMTWDEYNGEYNGSIIVQRKTSENSAWTNYATITPEEGAATYTYKDTTALNGYSYRVQVEDAAGQKRYTRIQTAVIDNLEIGDALPVGDDIRYVGGNLLVNGDFDLGASVWTDGLGNALDASKFIVLSAGGIDGGSYLQAMSNEVQGTAGALQLTVDVVPGQDYYASMAVCNDSYAYHFFELVAEDGTTETVLSSSISPTWSSFTKHFNSGTYSKIQVGFRRLGGKSQIDKLVICPVFATKAEAVAHGIANCAVRGAAVADYVAEIHPALAAELTATLASTTGDDEATLTVLTEAIDATLQAVKAIKTLQAQLPYAETLASYGLPGNEALEAAIEEARTATAAMDYVNALAHMNVAMDECFPYVYSPDYIKYPTFETFYTGWNVKAGTYTDGKQALGEVGGKSCWSAMWTGVSASEGAATTMAINQKVTGLDHGLYALECKATTDHHCLSDQHAWLAMDGDTLTSPTLSYDRADIPQIADSAVWETLSTPMVYVPQGGSLTLGFQGSKAGAVDNAWSELLNLEHPTDQREGWWAATDFTLRYMPVYRTTVDAAGWGVVCLPYQVTADKAKGVRLFSIVGILTDRSALCLEEVADGVGTAGEPYVYYSPDTCVTFFESGEPVTKAVNENYYLRGFFVTSAKIPAGGYALKDGAWYRVEKSARPSIGYYGAYLRETVGLTAYDSWAGHTLPISGAVEEYAEGIDNLLVDPAHAAEGDGLYTIDGRRVNNAQGSGVYIRVENGKAHKVVTK